MTDPLRRLAGLILAGATLAQAQAATPACTARSAARAPTVVELYTSEGCSSCPPADRWLSALKDEPNVIALAFHVDYWDRLGWKDRFASAAFTQRQAAQQAVNGARFSYTPQVVVAGRDRKDWPMLRLSGTAAGAPSGPSIEMQREADRYVATVVSTSDAAMDLSAYWAVTEDGHTSAVKAGENEGVTLHHDFVVREWQGIEAYTARPGVARTFEFHPGPGADGAHPRRVNFVVLDARSGRPVQALRLGC